MPDLPQLRDETEEVLERRFKEARAAGLSILAARVFAASNVDIGELRALVRGHCPPRLLARIVRPL